MSVIAELQFDHEIRSIKNPYKELYLLLLDALKRNWQRLEAKIDVLGSEA